MICLLKKIWRQARADIRLLGSRPKPHFEAAANLNYWAVRRAGGNTGANEFQKDRAAWISSRLKGESPTLLDIGSGSGEMLQALQALTKGLQITASDFEVDSQVRLRSLGYEVIALDISLPDFMSKLEQIDYITICEVLEHTPNPESSLKNLLPRARRAVYFSVPNSGYYAYRLRLLFGRFPVQWRAHPGEHVRYWTLSDMRWWLQHLGLADRATIKTYQGWPALNKLFPSLFAMGMLVEVKTEICSHRGDTLPGR